MFKKWKKNKSIVSKIGISINTKKVEKPFNYDGELLHHGVNDMKIDDVKRIISENHIKMDFIRINDKYLMPGTFYLYYDESSLNWAAFHYDREQNADLFFMTEDAACRNFLKLIFSSPENFADYSLKEAIGNRLHRRILF